MRIGLDTSSLNWLARTPERKVVLAALVDAESAPLVNSLSIIEILACEDAEQRDGLLAFVAELRGIADYRLLPLPHEVIEAEFAAWLRKEPIMVLGQEESAMALQDLLERPEGRRSDLHVAASSYAAAEQASHAARLRALREVLGRSFHVQVPRTEDEFFQGLFSARDGIASVLNRWFATSLEGHPPITAAEAADCVERLDRLRAYFVTIGLSAFNQGVLGSSIRRGPSAIDVTQAVYLPGATLFVADDAGMHAHLSAVARIAQLQTRLIRAVDLLGELQARPK